MHEIYSIIYINTYIHKLQDCYWYLWINFQNSGNWISRQESATGLVRKMVHAVHAASSRGHGTIPFLGWHHGTIPSNHLPKSVRAAALCKTESSSRRYHHLPWQVGCYLKIIRVKNNFYPTYVYIYVCVCMYIHIQVICHVQKSGCVWFRTLKHSIMFDPTRSKKITHRFNYPLVI